MNAREVKRIGRCINEQQKLIDDLYDKKVELENYTFQTQEKS